MKVFVIILDGCPSYQINHKITPFLQGLGKEGIFFKDCKTVFPSVTYCAHSSIVTGRYPNEHGMIGNLFFDKKLKKIMNFDDFNDLRDAVQAETIFKLLNVETAAICEPIPIDADHVTPFSSIYKQDLYMHNELVLNATLKWMDNPEIQFFCLNFTGVDGFAEQFGPRSNEFISEMLKVDQFVSYIYEKADDAIFIIVADHGMVDVQEYIDMSKIMKELDDEIVVTPSHRMCHLYCNDNQIKKVTEFLSKQPYIDKIFDINQVKQMNLDHDRTGNVVFSAKVGFEFGVKGLNGSHGGVDNEEINVPLLIFSKQCNIEFNQGHKQVKIIDIVPTVLNLFNLPIDSSLKGTNLILSIKDGSSE